MQDKTQWHVLEVAELLRQVNTDPERGLDAETVAQRQAEFGRNVLTPSKGQGPLLRFVLQFHQPLIYLLLGAGVVTGLLQEWVDMGVILGVVLVNAVIGFVQESKAVSAIEALARQMSNESTVLREGKKQQLDARELVPGDIVLLAAGDKAPADLRLLQLRDLQVDESALTGESVPVQKQTKPLEADAPLADRTNMAYSSALITHGTGSGVVIATGDRTEMGRISELIANTQVLATPMTQKIAHFSHVFLWVIVGVATLMFFAGLWRGGAAIDMFMAAVALAVAVIPEGLPAVITITLALGVAQMARRNAIIRKLPAVETLGSTTVICSDKTGTLTQNQMTVQEIWAGHARYRVSGVGYLPEGKITDTTAEDEALNAAAQETLLAGLLCNDARLVFAEELWHVEGDPTEGALISAAQKAGLTPEESAKKRPREDEIPFASEHQYMATLHREDGGKKVVYLKGSLEALLPRSTLIMEADGTTQPLNREGVQNIVEEIAAKGLRVLAFARKELAQKATGLSPADVEGELTFLGLQGMIDPARDEVIPAIEACKTAGIHVKMITGDHLGTATAIARDIGILEGADPDRPSAITGKDLTEVSDADLPETVDATRVFARVSPEQKLRLVEALQTRDHVVAMTGDGVNDAPALRRANIGVAMGITGTEVAKEAADMVLTDDNFASIAAAVEEGRTVFDNLVKFITWTLPTNVGEGLIILVAVFAGIALPVLPVQILWVNMTTAVLLGLMLAFEAKEPDVMERMPRDPKSPLLTRAMIFRIGLVGLLLLISAFTAFKWFLLSGSSEAEARTVAVNVFVFGELFYLFNCRSLTKSAFKLGFFSNRWIFVGVGLMIALQLLFTYWSVFNTVFSSAPLGWDAWLIILGAGLAIYLIVDLDKWRANRAQQRRITPAH